jgi:hypothetical protein
MRLDRKIIYVLVLVCLVILLWFALDHVLFPDLPVPGGAPPITK